MSGIRDWEKPDYREIRRKKNRRKQLDKLHREEAIKRKTDKKDLRRANAKH